MISCRCFSRRLASRRSLQRAIRLAHQTATDRTTDENSRPNENCVARISDSTSSVRMTMIEPVRFSESASSAARITPM